MTNDTDTETAATLTTDAPVKSRAPRTPKPPVDFQSPEIQVADDPKQQAFATLFGTRYLDGFQDPVIFRNAKFYSPAVQQSYKRDFALISRTLYGEYIYRRRPAYNQEILDSFSNLCATKLAAIKELLNRNVARIHTACKTQGQEVDASYLSYVHRTVPIIHAHALQYLQCLQSLDLLLQATGSATLNGVITAEQRKEAELQARRAINAFSSMVRAESGKIRKEARRVIEQISPHDDEMKKAESVQSAAIDEFDASEGGAPGADHSRDAAAAIDGMAASARAVESASGRNGQPEAAAVPA